MPTPTDAGIELEIFGLRIGYALRQMDGRNPSESYIDYAERTYAQSMRQINDMERDIDRLTQELNNNRVKSKRRKMEIIGLGKVISTLTQELNDLARRYDELEQQVADYKTDDQSQEIAALKIVMDALKEENRLLTLGIEKANQDLSVARVKEVARYDHDADLRGLERKVQHLDAEIMMTRNYIEKIARAVGIQRGFTFADVVKLVQQKVRQLDELTAQFAITDELISDVKKMLGGTDTTLYAVAKRAYTDLQDLARLREVERFTALIIQNSLWIGPNVIVLSNGDNAVESLRKLIGTEYLSIVEKIEPGKTTDAVVSVGRAELERLRQIAELAVVVMNPLDGSETGDAWQQWNNSCAQLTKLLEERDSDHVNENKAS